jgi:hypothetical protein
MYKVRRQKLFSRKLDTGFKPYLLPISFKGLLTIILPQISTKTRRHCKVYISPPMGTFISNDAVQQARFTKSFRFSKSETQARH